MKNTPEWKQYEWLISKIFHDSYSSIKTIVLPDSKIKGAYSERSRQIDILIEGSDFKTIIECKHHKVPVDIKDIESFLGLFNDVGADYGIVVSSAGFSKSAQKRISEYSNKIKLEHINWEAAYNSFITQRYEKFGDVCLKCSDSFIEGRMVPGLLLWEHGYALEGGDGTVSMFSLSKCLNCGNRTIYCDVCGVVSNIDESKCCKYSKIFLSLV